ncbi:MAG: hypothetical protein Fur0027_03300 [Raineya sp.]
MANTTQQSYEEIDLIELTIKIYKFLKKRILLIILCTVLSAIIGSALSFISLQPRYQSAMIISSRSLTASEVAGMIKTLDNLAQEENEKEITNLTGIPEKLAKKIYKIEAIPNREYQQNTEKDFRKDSTIAIKLEVTEKDNWQAYQKGIINYLENIPYVKKKTALYKERQEKLLKNVQKEIKHLDSLKRIVEAVATTKTQVILNNAGFFYSEIIKLYETENQIKANLASPNDIELIKDFTNYQKPQKFSVRHTVLLFGLIGSLLGILWALVIEFNKIIRKREGRE